MTADHGLIITRLRNAGWINVEVTYDREDGWTVDATMIHDGPLPVVTPPDGIARYLTWADAKGRIHIDAETTGWDEPGLAAAVLEELARRILDKGGDQ